MNLTLFMISVDSIFTYMKEPAILRTGLLARSLTHGAVLKFTSKNQTLITMSIFFNFCVVIDDSLGGLWHGVKNALGILHLAVDFYKLLLLV
ncbi:hypothetical protein Peur_033538 [Populus x canadensis]